MNTKAKGDISVAAFMKFFLQKGFHVLVPFGDNASYDLVVDDMGKFIRYQVKTGWVRGSRIYFKTSSIVSKKDGKFKSVGYDPNIWFAVYAPELDRFYLISGDQAPKSSMILRIGKPKKRSPNIRWASDFEVK